MDNIQSFLYDQIGYRKIEQLLKKKRIYFPYLMDFFSGTVLGSWRPSIKSSTDISTQWPRVPYIKQKVRNSENMFSHRLLLKDFFVGYTLDGVDGFLSSSRRKYFPYAHLEIPNIELTKNSWRAWLKSPSIEIEINEAPIKEAKYCTIDFLLEDSDVDKINRLIKEYSIRIGEEIKKLTIK
ncbi:MAG: hypothetical protein Q8R18_05815 [bacterium]|nr:hypothetical protein [bacterium]